MLNQNFFYQNWRRLFLAHLSCFGETGLCPAYYSSFCRFISISIDSEMKNFCYFSFMLKLASDMHQWISKMEPKALQLEVGDGDLGTKLFSLYLAAKEIVEYSQYLPLRLETIFTLSCSFLGQ